MISFIIKRNICNVKHLCTDTFNKCVLRLGFMLHVITFDLQNTAEGEQGDTYV